MCRVRRTAWNFEQRGPPSADETKPMKNDVLIVGAGLSGAVVARELAEQTAARIFVVDSRPHIAGNCHTERA
jgi:cation diffusion facilitator CzcD-associated flavoprotein CzcO